MTGEREAGGISKIPLIPPALAAFRSQNTKPKKEETS